MPCNGGDGVNDGQAERELREMMKECEAMRDEAKAFEVRSAVDQDSIVVSLVPFLLSLSSHEEEANINRKAASTKAHPPRGPGPKAMGLPITSTLSRSAEVIDMPNGRG